MYYTFILSMSCSWCVSWCVVMLSSLRQQFCSSRNIFFDCESAPYGSRYFHWNEQRTDVKNSPFRSIQWHRVENFESKQTLQKGKQKRKKTIDPNNELSTCSGTALGASIGIFLTGSASYGSSIKLSTGKTIDIFVVVTTMQCKDRTYCYTEEAQI